MNGEEIVCTGGHPFYVIGMGFVEARNLNTSDKLLLSDGSRVTIEAIEVEELAEPETTYNFEVADFYTYYVSESKVLVHNTCVYKGGDKMKVRPRDVDMVDDLVQPTRGVSVNSNPNAVSQFGKPHKVGKLPKELKLVRTAGTHYEIVPKFAMSLEKYQSLLNSISLTPI